MKKRQHYKTLFRYFIVAGAVFMMALLTNSYTQVLTTTEEDININPVTYDVGRIVCIKTPEELALLENYIGDIQPPIEYSDSGLQNPFTFNGDNLMEEVIVTRYTEPTKIYTEQIIYVECAPAPIVGSETNAPTYFPTIGSGMPWLEAALLAESDRCKKLREMASKIDAIRNDPKVKAAMEKLMKDFKDSPNEHGFTVKLTANGLEVSEIIKGSENSLEVPYDENTILVVHTHPKGSSVVHSSTDIYSLANHRKNPSFLGSVTVQGDQIHLLSITNLERYEYFIQSKDKDYDRSTLSGWKEQSRLDNDFLSFSGQYAQMYRGVDATYPTQLYLMDKYKMGVSLFRMNSDGSSSPIKVTATRKMTLGSSTTMNMGGQTINSDYESIDIYEDCK
ncbi:hypothetical protein BWD42_07675 [Sphingobacterium sp. CZ-UAM]|uniref:hypothetical protein n=1 Tax=Sphingobacterium sp. CZ-UAM TaxID=1933868 RepID=UPI0009847F71|nr:hypothetical protein [Sphingobacterium sp. CZ-UAM]OOG19770.1 hypothetical protein BWD42_07675 [Sphingobacterium sp. CZ-UAM]